MPKKKKTEEEIVETETTKEEKPKKAKKSEAKTKSASKAKSAKTETKKKSGTKKVAPKSKTNIEETKSEVEPETIEEVQLEEAATKDEVTTIKSVTSAAAINKARAEKELLEMPIETEIKIDSDLRYSDEDLAEFEEIILEQKKDQLEELYMLRERLEDLNSEESAEESMIYSMHMAEQGSEAIEKEKTYAQVQRINEYLKKLDEALQRIKDKTYGVCRKCGILIAKERLKAVPITTLSASYKIHQNCPEDGIDRIEPKRDGN